MSERVTRWLQEQGLGEYAAAFASHAIDEDLLADLTDSDLQTIGVTLLGHRKRLLKAIASLPAGTPDAATAGKGASLPSRDSGSLAGVAERRQLTVMFCDLVNSTALTSALGLEEFRELLTAYQSVSARAIARYDGYIARFMGDGLLVYFGFPQAHEDDAERALRAGLAVVRAIAAVPPKQGARAQVRIGIATGEVLAGDLVGEGASEERSVLGDTPNLAARLQAIAEPGAILISASTRKLTGRLFHYDDAGRHELKGFREWVQVWRVAGEADSESRFAATRNVEGTELIGREAELLLLLERWQRATAREGQVVLLSGEPGIGKSRLIHALRSRIREQAHVVLQFQCSPHHVNSAYYPFIEHIQRSCGITADQTAGDKLARLEAWLALGQGVAEDAVTLLADLLAIPRPHDGPAPAVNPQRQSEQIKEILYSRCVAHARDAPVLMVFEDLHWADPTTLDVIAGIVDEAPERAMLLLATHRPEFTPRWRGRGQITVHSLTRLGRKQVAAIVEGLAPGLAAFAPLLEDIVAKTDGVPLFVEELTKAVLEAGALTRPGSSPARRGPAAELAIPSTLQDSLAARLDRLGAAKSVAQVAAAIGREFSYDFLAALSQFDEPFLRDGLSRLERSELIHRRGTPPHAHYVFKHALVQDAAYASMLKRRRESLHATLAGVLETRFAQRAAQEPELLAHHYTQAGLATEAVSGWRRAADQALERSAYRERLAHLDSALEVLHAHPDFPRRRECELEVQLARGGALMATHGYRAAETGEAFARARALADGVADPRQSFAALRGLHGVHYARAQFDSALEVSRSCLALARNEGDPQHLSLAHRLVGQTHCMSGQLCLAREHLEGALSMSANLDSDDVAALTGGGHHLMASAFLAQVLWLQGYPDRALAMSLDALARAERHFGAFAVTTNLFFHCWIRGWRGEFAQFREHAARIGRLTAEHEISEWVAPGALLTDWPTLASGSAPEAAALARLRLPTVRALAGVMLPFKLGLLARALAPESEAEAVEVIDEALRVGEQGERWSDAELLRIKAHILLARDEAAAETCLHRAVEVARAQGARSWELRAATSLAALRCRQGRHTHARELLEPIHGWFTEGFETESLTAARALLGTIRQGEGSRSHAG